jgi:hypothetical protein
MENFSSLEQLDEVLKYLKQQTSPPRKSIGEIIEVLRHTLNLGDNDFLLILKKLIKDGFVATEEIDVSHPSPVAHPPILSLRYIITFEGKLFLESPGGYVKQTEQQHAAGRRLERLEAEQRQNQKDMKRLNRWIAIGTVAAAVIGLLLLCWQIVEHFHLLPDCSVRAKSV